MDNTIDTTQYTTFTENSTAKLFEPYNPPRGYNISKFAVKYQWGRTSVYYAINGNGTLSLSTRAEIRAELREDVEMWKEANQAA